MSSVFVNVECLCKKFGKKIIYLLAMFAFAVTVALFCKITNNLLRSRN